MDDGSRRGIPIESSQQQDTSAKPGLNPAQRLTSILPGSGEQQYRSISSTTPLSAPRSMINTASTYTYTTDAGASSIAPQHPGETSLRYQPGYVTDNRHSQPHDPFNASLLFGLNQDPTPSTFYDYPQFTGRQSASMHLPSEMPPSYYGSEEDLRPVLSGMRTQVVASLSDMYEPSLRGYHTGSHDFAIDQSTTSRTEESSLLPSGALDEAYAAYHDAIKQVFLNIQDGKLALGSTAILDLSAWILSNVVRLGLNADNASLHNDRMRLWSEFNHAWLTLLQRQKNMTVHAIQTETWPRFPQTWISHEQLSKMAEELIRLCDIIERHGLVDYQMGVWEEDIMNILLECLDILDDPEEDLPLTSRAFPGRS